jgi:alkaline phosphatase D
MSVMDRRTFLQAALAIGATAVWKAPNARPSTILRYESRELFPEGVASGDPDSSSVLLWTQRPYDLHNHSKMLLVEMAEDPDFRSPVATAPAPVSEASDWTCRVLVGGLGPSTIYWYRFTDSGGNGSRTGRTITAPAETDERSVRFAFVSCQNANQGAQNAYRRMIFEDERAPVEDQLQFVLHLGDFIYEIVWYPEDRPQGMYDRRIRNIVRHPRGEEINDFHIPTCVDDYRAVYRAYLHDLDLQDARARWPFVNMWDNHEYSWKGWQGLQRFGSMTRPAQTRKVAANQAFFEFQPARIYKPSGLSLNSFDGPHVTDTPITRFDDHGLGEEPNNLTAINSLRGYRSLRWGRNVELIVTDQRSYRSEEPLEHPEAQPFVSDDFPEFLPEEAIEILDASRSYNNGNPPEAIPYGNASIPNFRKNAPPQTILGAEQKQWFLNRLRESNATWKVWGNTTATLKMRADLQNLPPVFAKKWPGAGYAGCASCDHSTALAERSEIYDFVREHGITGFATIAGDRHSFWAGLAVKSLPPRLTAPVGIAFIVGSISAPGAIEALEHVLPKDHPLRALYLGQAASDSAAQPTFNMLLRHGVRSCLAYQESGDIAKARSVSNPHLAPHLSFVDMGGHGYAIVRASKNDFVTEFICIPRPLERSASADGGPVLYRIRFSTALWKVDQVAHMKAEVLDGNPRFSLG